MPFIPGIEFLASMMGPAQVPDFLKDMTKRSVQKNTRDQQSNTPRPMPAERKLGRADFKLLLDQWRKKAEAERQKR